MFHPNPQESTQQDQKSPKVQSISQPGWKLTIDEYRAQCRKNYKGIDPSKYQFKGRFINASLLNLIDFTESESKVIRRYAHKPQNFFIFSGDVGIGKTYVGAAMYNQWWEDGKDVQYVNCDELFSQMKTCIEENKCEDNILNRYLDADFLIIDDVGTTPPTDWNVSKFYKIINSRYESRKPTYISTNLTKKNLAKFVDFRNEDRLLASENIFFTKTGPSKRKKGL